MFHWRFIKVHDTAGVVLALPCQSLGVAAMERASSPEYLPELQLRALSEELRAQEDQECDSMPPDEVRLHLGSLANSVALEDAKPPVRPPLPCPQCL